MIQWSVDCEFSLQNLAVDHRDQSWAEVIPDCDQLTALHLLIVFDWLALLTLQVLILWIKRGIEGRLECVGVDDAKLFEHDQSCRCFLVFFIGELAITEWEKLVLLRKKVRQHFDKIVILVLIDFALARDASVHEDVSLSTVAMHVAKEHDLIFFVVSCHELFCEVNRRMQKAWWIGPSTVEIATNCIASIVANDDAIRIQHRHDLEYKRITK